MTVTDAAAAPAPETTKPRRPRRSWLALVLAVIALIGVIAIVNTQNQVAGGKGPLTTNDPLGDQGNGLASRKVGDFVCYGYAQLINPGSKAATIKSVRVNSADGFDVGPVTVLGADRGEFLTATAETCPEGGAKPEGYKIPPGATTARPNFGVELIVPLHLAKSGEHRITGITVTYEIDGKMYTVEQQSDLQMCTTACRIGHA